jgi:hypothetical protein
MKYKNMLKSAFVRLTLLFLIANIFLLFTYSSNPIKAFAQGACSQTLTITKVVGGNIDTSTANNLAFPITLRLNDVPNSFTLTQASPVSRCVNAGDRINVAEDSSTSGSQFTFATPSLSSDCSTTVQAGVNLDCTITDTVTGTTNSAAATPQAITIPAGPNVQPNTGAILIANANNTSQLKIITHNVNDCLPQTSCTNISSKYPNVDVNTLDENNKYSTISSFPGSEVGRTVNVIVLASGIQYDVSQKTGANSGYPNMTTHSSPDCQGTMHVNDHKVCTINNIIQNPTGQLKIITHNVNDCLPQTRCTHLASVYPTVVVHTLDENNKYSTISSFPGSEVGRTVNFQGIFPLGLQYDALQENSFPPNANITTHSSPDCQGTMHVNDHKVCTINNNITSAS